MYNPLNLENKKILITGASSGIGKATAVYLSRLGAEIILVARDQNNLEDSLVELEGSNHKAISYDLLQLANIEEIFAEATKDGRKLNGLVHSAGMSYVTPVRTLSQEMLQKEMALNYFSFIELVKQFSKSKYSDGGSIVGISSIAAVTPEKCQTNYAASKAAMNAAVASLAQELASKRIRINTVMPGAVNTRLAKQSQNNGIDIDAILEKQLLGMEEPQDVASVCAFLLSDMAGMITGRSVFADGGRL